MHFNPCDDRWLLSEKPSDYEQSSAALYQFGKAGAVQVRGHLDFLALLGKEEDERKNSSR